MHGKMRTAGLRKDRAYSEETLQLLINLIRFKHNFLTPLSILGNKTPIEAALGHSFRSWEHLISFAQCVTPNPTQLKRKNKIATILDYC